MLVEAKCKQPNKQKTYLIRLYCTIVQHSKDHLKKAKSLEPQSKM